MSKINEVASSSSNSADLSGKRLELILAALGDGKAEAVTTLPTERQSNGLFAFMVIATVGSSRHSAALTQRVKKALKGAGAGSPAVEASEGGEWTLIDSGDIIIHIMLPAARERYDLESLWRLPPP